MDVTFIPAGDRAVTIQFEQKISEQVNNRVARLAQQLAEQSIVGIEEWVPAYASLTIYYHPLKISYDMLLDTVRGLLTSSISHHALEGRTFTIPVLYGGKQGPDLKDVASCHGMREHEVIQLHTEPVYRVYMLGFSPGFPYLGGLPASLHTPRLETPRTQIPAGSVGIADQQTGIYSLSSPGGWRIIGHTPVPLFRPDKEQQPSLLRAGDRIRFRAVSVDEYHNLCEQVKQGKEVVTVED